jgi:hypothetical protein
MLKLICFVDQQVLSFGEWSLRGAFCLVKIGSLFLRNQGFLILMLFQNLGIGEGGLESYFEELKMSQISLLL